MHYMCYYVSGEMMYKLYRIQMYLCILRYDVLSILLLYHLQTPGVELRIWLKSNWLLKAQHAYTQMRFGKR